MLAGRLGTRYKDVRLSNFQTPNPEQQTVRDAVKDYLEDLKQRIELGQSVMFYGPPGTGKDHMLVAMMRVAILDGYFVKWKDGSEMFGEFRDNIRGDVNEAKLIDSYTTKADVLAISDPVPPFGGLTPYQSGMFFRIVDRRYREMKPTWITINVRDSKEAGERIGTSIVDRLGENAMSLHCNWNSYRRGDQ